jgi:hypothetical protein
MKIMYLCGKCRGQNEGLLVKKTNYENTSNMDELDVCCFFCGNLLAKMWTQRSFPEEKQKELWKKHNKERNVKKE